MKKKEKIRKLKKKGKKKEKVSKKKEESIVDYYCNPQCFWVWRNSDFPTPFSYMYKKKEKK